MVPQRQFQRGTTAATANTDLTPRDYVPEPIGGEKEHSRSTYRGKARKCERASAHSLALAKSGALPAMTNAKSQYVPLLPMNGGRGSIRVQCRSRTRSPVALDKTRTHGGRGL